MTTITAPQPEHVEAWRLDYEADVRTVIKPRPRLTLAHWSERYRQMGGGSAEKGPWRNERVPYLVEIMNCVSDPTVERIVVMKPARVGFTEGVIINSIGYFMHQDPSAILVALPTIDDAEQFSKTKLRPAIDATDVLRDMMPKARGRDGSNTILYKEYAGGNVQLVGTNSPRMLRMKDARVLSADEVDAMPPTSGDEGDTITLLEKRVDNAPNRKIIIGSSPKLKGISRIEVAYQDSDRRRYWMPCPQCGEMQVLMFGTRETPWGLKWVNRRPETAVYVCVNGCTIEERTKRAMHEGAAWRPDNPSHATRGYWFNALVSMFDGVRWPRLVDSWLKAQANPETLQVFINTALAETYELRGEKIEGDSLFNRREVYADEVPNEVGVLTAFVDVQRGSGGWLEVFVRGWGKDQESWRILHQRIEGSIDDIEVHEQLDAILLRPYHHASGTQLRIKRAFIDSGDQAAAVYAYVKPRQGKGIFASKGDKAIQNAPIVVRAKKPNDAGVKLMTIGTFTAKRRMFFRLKLTKPGPGYMHFHRLPDDADVAERAAFDAQDTEYFAQFANEKLVPAKDSKGNRTFQYVQTGDRNESIDGEVGCLAALHALGPSIYDRLGRIVESVQRRGAAGETRAEPNDQEQVKSVARQKMKRPGGWVRGWMR